MRQLLAFLVTGWALAAAPGQAIAGPRADAIARHADADVAALRAELPGDATVRCTLGAVYAARGDLSRAGLYLERCNEATLDEDITDPVARARRDVKHKAKDSSLSGIDVLTDPEGAWAEIDTLPGDRFQTPLTVYVPAGHHVVTVTSAAGAVFTNAIDSRPHAQGPLLIALGAPPPPAAHAGSVDFGEDNAGDAQAAPPPDLKHPSIIPQHYVDGGTTAGPHIDDPLAGLPAPAATHAWRLGLRFGGGVFDHSGADARLGFVAGGVLTVPVTSRVALAARLDWSRRGGSSDATPGVDSLGATAGAQLALARLAPFAVLAGGGLRAAVQLDTMDTSRATLAGAAWLELPLHTTPLMVGLRFEQGLSDRVALAELGITFP